MSFHSFEILSIVFTSLHLILLLTVSWFIISEKLSVYFPLKANQQFHRVCENITVSISTIEVVLLHQKLCFVDPLVIILSICFPFNRSNTEVQCWADDQWRIDLTEKHWTACKQAKSPGKMSSWGQATVYFCKTCEFLLFHQNIF